MVSEVPQAAAEEFSRGFRNLHIFPLGFPLSAHIPGLVLFSPCSCGTRSWASTTTMDQGRGDFRGKKRGGNPGCSQQNSQGFAREGEGEGTPQLPPLVSLLPADCFGVSSRVSRELCPGRSYPGILWQPVSSVCHNPAVQVSGTSEQCARGFCYYYCCYYYLGVSFHQFLPEHVCRQTANQHMSVYQKQLF